MFTYSPQSIESAPTIIMHCNQHPGPPPSSLSSTGSLTCSKPPFIHSFAVSPLLTAPDSSCQCQEEASGSSGRLPSGKDSSLVLGFPSRAAAAYEGLQGHTSLYMWSHPSNHNLTSFVPSSDIFSTHTCKWVFSSLYDHLKLKSHSLIHTLVAEATLRGLSAVNSFQPLTHIPSLMTQHH